MLDDISILTIENLAKSYGEKVLFENINFTISDFDKIGLIGVNGTGKSTLLKIIMGLETKDTGEISSMKGINVEYLSQNPSYNSEATILEQIFKGSSESLDCIRNYEEILELIEEDPDNSKLQGQLLELSNKMKALDLWDYESQVKTILTKLGITNFHKKMRELSGGQRKRVSLASVLISPCDLLILDEPTNHMDNETIDWLEEYLKNRKGALLMITHDRYFLDRVVNKTIELDHGQMYTYTGNYSYFVEKKAERQLIQSALEQKRLNLYRNELAWMRRGALARTTKQKARIQRFEDLEKTKHTFDEEKLTIPVAYSRLGNKIIEINHVSKSYGELSVINDFSYTILKNDRIGIIGDNGVGKSTLLNIIVQKLTPDEGSVDIGSTVKIGYFSQEAEDMDENMRAIEYIKDVAEYVTTADGVKVSASQIMETFLFNKDMQWTMISRLSGGERRRLYLLKVLIFQPNILILDEPTNDLDLDTLKVLESYIDNFQGIVISVSHDRYFLDRICKRIFSFEGKGKIVENTGNYSDYMAKRVIEPIVPAKKNTVKDKGLESPEKSPQKPKFSFKEKFEFEKLPEEIEKLEKDLSLIEEGISHAATDFEKLQELVTQKDKLEEELLYKLERQEYFMQLQEQIDNYSKQQV